MGGLGVISHTKESSIAREGRLHPTRCFRRRYTPKQTGYGIPQKDWVRYPKESGALGQASREQVDAELGEGDGLHCLFMSRVFWVVAPYKAKGLKPQQYGCF